MQVLLIGSPFPVPDRELVSTAVGELIGNEIQTPHVIRSVYILMGWLAVIAMRPLNRAIGCHGLCWLGAGGLFYTAGILFFAFDRVRYFHALWHVFVLAGSISHYFAVLLYVVPNASGTQGR